MTQKKLGREKPDFSSLYCMYTEEDALHSDMLKEDFQPNGEFHPQTLLSALSPLLFSQRLKHESGAVDSEVCEWSRIVETHYLWNCDVGVETLLKTLQCESCIALWVVAEAILVMDTSSPLHMKVNLPAWLDLCCCDLGELNIESQYYNISFIVCNILSVITAKDYSPLTSPLFFNSLLWVQLFCCSEPVVIFHFGNQFGMSLSNHGNHGFF